MYKVKYAFDCVNYSFSNIKHTHFADLEKVSFLAIIQCFAVFFVTKFHLTNICKYTPFFCVNNNFYF